MTKAPASNAQPLPRGVFAATLGGSAAGLLAWWLVSVWPAFTDSYARLDQLAALTLGGVVGAVVLGARAMRQRRAVVLSTGAGLVAGGIAALLVSSLTLFYAGPLTPRLFVALRALEWGFTAASACIALRLAIRLATPSSLGHTAVVETGLIGFGGGIIAGLIDSLPGSADAWQAAGFAWWGAAVGLAVAGPELWRAMAIVENLPPRRKQPNLLTLRESPLYDGSSVELGEAKIACFGDGVAIYPPASGVLSNGHHIYSAQWLPPVALVQVGRNRHRVRRLWGSA